MQERENGFFNWDWWEDGRKKGSLGSPMRLSEMRERNAEGGRRLCLGFQGAF